jgi:hypothetical protein
MVERLDSYESENIAENNCELAGCHMKLLSSHVGLKLQCGHVFCKNCLKMHFSNKTKGMFVCSKFDKLGEVQLKCPTDVCDCWHMITTSELQTIIGAETFDKKSFECAQRIQKLGKKPTRKY